MHNPKKAASKLQQSQFSGKHIRIPDIQHQYYSTVYGTIIALFIVVLKVNYVHLLSYTVFNCIQAA